MYLTWYICCQPFLCILERYAFTTDFHFYLLHNHKLGIQCGKRLWLDTNWGDWYDCNEPV